MGVGSGIGRRTGRSFPFSEPALESRKITLRNYVRQNIDGARHIFANSKIRAVSVFSILINFTAYAGLWYLYEPRIAQAGFTGQLLGILVAGTYLIRAVGTKLIPAVLRR
ncbi:hypothetical protein A2Z33_02185 [Candidatus Gottesmanbacteria bacterium RBG_16_52_11]|uniref:Uncharacterized protein n=1 Tax=Candidatus Gottesmanbacteria bacterium RBG_16_52_11 TaxID=1798374 RepID=A0A1F5YR26_9BACT|nr:MAG: hypothetical protein A2Z33_02185 [Candidatus Gottesmanbacteria bacterium RBG_16_52_11]